MPVVPANMKCVIDASTAHYMSENEYFYIMHRFNERVEDKPNQFNCEFVRLANEDNWKTISISVGVSEDDKGFLVWCDENNFRIDYLTIDIAHGHSLRMKEMIEFIRSGSNTYRNVFLIAGNVATPEAVYSLGFWGADTIKVGIAQGDACTTYGKTGFGTPMFSCINECFDSAHKPIIADGGIRTNGDFAKAIYAGATMVMAGSVFAACIDAPAESKYDDYTIRLMVEGQLQRERVCEWAKRPTFPKLAAAIEDTQSPLPKPTHKIYYGSASEANKHNKHHVEGRTVELACNGMTYKEKLIEIQEDLQSAISYAGGNLRDVRWGIRDT